MIIDEDPPEKSPESFTAIVEAAGLMARICNAYHWQIKGGKRHILVDCWPDTKKGFRFQAVDFYGRPVRCGTVTDAIELAGPLKTPKAEIERAVE